MTWYIDFVVKNFKQYGKMKKTMGQSVTLVFDFETYWVFFFVIQQSLFVETLNIYRTLISVFSGNGITFRIFKIFLSYLWLFSIYVDTNCIVR